MSEDEVSEIEVTVTGTGPTPRGLGPGDRWRAATAMGALLVRRRAWRDRGLVLASALLVLASTLLSVVAPRLVLDVVDRGVVDVLEGLDDRAEIIVRANVGNSGSAVPGLRGELFDQFARAATEIDEHLPPHLASVAGQSAAAAISPRTQVTAIEVPTTGARVDEPDDDGASDEAAAALEPLTWRGDRELQVFALDVGAPASDLVRVVAGELPGTPRPPTGDRTVTDIALTAPVAQALDLEVGAQLQVTVRSGELAWLEVTGVVEAVDPAAPVWRLAPEVLAPHVRESTTTAPALARGTVLASAAGAAGLAETINQPSTGSIRVTVTPTAFDTTVAAAVVDELAAVRSTPTAVVPALRHATFTADFASLLAEYPARARAALAQMSVVAAGVVGVAAVVIGLLARLLVGRRSGQIALERARGSTVAAVVGRVLGESLVVTALAMAGGVAASQLFVDGLAGTTLPLVAVGLAAVGSAPVIGGLAARAMWTGRREPANRQDRARLAKRRRTKRVVVEATIALLTVAGVVSLRGRGVLQTSTGGIDPFLAVVPLLLSLTVTLLVVRLFPYPVRAVGRLVRRGRGALGLLAAATSARAVAVLPLLAITLGVGITTASGLLAGTVTEGQERAAWERVGADVRFETALAAEDLEALRAADGVTHVAEGIIAATTIDLGPVSDRFTVVAVEREILDVLGAAPGGEPASLAPVFETVADGEPLAMVVSPAVAARMSGEDVSMYFGPAYLTARLAGTTTVSLQGYADGPFVFLDLAQVDARMNEPRERTTVWVTGPGATEAVAGLPDIAPLAQSRAAWLEANRGSALVGGVQSMLGYAMVTVAFLVAMALVATVLAGARSRGVVLSMLRTLGLRSGYGWWLALAELVPVVVAALAGGVLAGTAILLLLGPALGLVVLTGGVGDPSLVVEPGFVLAVAVAAVVLLAVAVLAEVLAHRRDKLSEVLRVGVSS